MAGLLKPKKYKFTKVQKNRLKWGMKFATFKYGNAGLVLSKPLALKSENFGNFKLRLRRTCTKRDKTYRQFWINAFPSLPLTRKSINARMGKGRGKLKEWYSYSVPGTIFIELRNLRLGRARYTLNVIRLSLRGTDFIKIKSPRFVTLPFNYFYRKPILPFF